MWFVFCGQRGKNPFVQLNSLVLRVIQDLRIVCEDMSSPVGESVDTTYLKYSVKKRAKEMARYQGVEIYY